MDNFENYKTDCYWYADETIMGCPFCLCEKRGCECACKECKFYLKGGRMMDKYISREELIEEIEEEIAIGDKFDEKDVLINKGLKIALKYIKRQPSADVQSVNQWISCKDKMPEDRMLVLFCYVNEKGVRSVHYGYHFNINGITAWAKPSGGLNYCDEEITHWQPLPEPPKDGDAE